MGRIVDNMEGYDTVPDAEDGTYRTFGRVNDEMKKHGHTLMDMRGSEKTIHATDYDGVKYLILKKKNWYDVLIKTDMKLAL